MWGLGIPGTLNFGEEISKRGSWILSRVEIDLHLLFVLWVYLCIKSVQLDLGDLLSKERGCALSSLMFM